MNKLMAAVCLVLAASGAYAAAQYRNFTDTQDRVIRGRVVRFDTTKEIVTIERENRKTAKVPITIFCDDDQDYIRSWGKGNAFESTFNFKVTINRKKESNDRVERELSRRFPQYNLRVQDTHYEVVLQNRSDTTLENLRVEYCIFYEQKMPGAKKEDNGVYCGQMSVNHLASKSSQTLTSDKVTIFKSDLDGNYYYESGASSIQRGDVHGIWVRIYMKLPAGGTLMREHSFPEDTPEGRTWATETVAVGLNSDEKK